MYSVTQAFVEWLVAKGYDAHTYPPSDAPDEFATVERTGGNVSDLVDHATIAVQTWALTEADAEEAAITIRDALLTGERPDGVARVDADAGPYPFWDESTGRARYQTVYTAHCILVD